MQESDINVQQMTRAFWEWSGRAYNDMELRDCLLDLQDSYGLNVNFLLLAVWAEVEAIGIDQSRWSAIATATTQANKTVESIREQRRKAKVLNPQQYQKILKLELKAEQVVQKHAIGCLAKALQSGVRTAKSGLNFNLNQYLACVEAMQEFAAADEHFTQARADRVADLSLLVENQRF